MFCSANRNIHKLQEGNKVLYAKMEENNSDKSQNKGQKYVQCLIFLIVYLQQIFFLFPFSDFCKSIFNITFMPYFFYGVTLLFCISFFSLYAHIKIEFVFLTYIEK